MLQFLIPLIISTSFSVRTPNDTTQPLDYEFSFKVEDTAGQLKYSLKRDWERELGEKYIDDLAMLDYKWKSAYYRFEYTNKESQEINYLTNSFGWEHSSGIRLGVSARFDEEGTTPLGHLSWIKKLKKDDLEYNVYLSLKTNLQGDEILSTKSEVKKWFTEKINIFALYKHEYYNQKEDFQFKVGLGVKL